MKKRNVAVFMCIVLGVSGLIGGCGNRENGGNESQGNTGTESEERGSSTAGGSAVIWTNLENEAEMLQEYAVKYEEETGNHVEVIHETSDIQQFAQAVKSADGPDGIYGIANDQLANYIDAGLVAEVPDDVFSDSNYADAAVQACYADGKRYGVPIAVETNALFYNTEKIPSAPQTWEELLELAKENGGIQFEATSIYYDLGFLRAFDSYIFGYENGAYDTTDIGLGNENAVKAYEFINKMVQEYQFFGSDITSDTARGNFQNGQTAFYIGGPWDVEGFAAAGTKFAVAAMPTLNGKEFVTPVGTQVGFVSSKSDSQEAVWEFYKYLLENAGEDLYQAGGRIPARLSAQEAIEADEVTKSFMEQISYGEPMPTVSEMGQVWTPYSDNMKLMMTGQCTPEEAARYIFTQLEEGIALMNSGK